MKGTLRAGSRSLRSKTLISLNMELLKVNGEHMPQQSSDNLQNI